MANYAHVTIDLDDVVREGGVEAAIIAWCEASDDTSCGVIGPSFATSGPGSGWSKEYDADDYAVRAVEGGALYYLDESDGRMRTAEDASDAERDEDGEWPSDVIHDMGGGRSRLSDWSADSVVRLECPTIEEATEHPVLVAEMAQAVIDYHHAESDTADWASLIRSIRDAAEAFEAIDKPQGD